MTTLSSGEVIAPAELSAPGVSWPAIFAGALATTALSLILFVLGSGLGLAMVSPWTAAGAGVTTFAVSTAIWLLIMQWVSAGVGGYLAGRLRTKWSGLHTDEVSFRDTAHGFFAWSLSTLLVAGLLSSAVTSTVGGGASAAAQGVAQVAASKMSDADSLQTDYFVDMFFRPADTATTGSSNNMVNINDSKSEASLILLNSVANGAVSEPDKKQLTHLVSAKSGLSEADAKARVDQVLTQIDTAKVKAKETTDKARKAGIVLSLMTALSLFVGAFIASVAAALGGRQRDTY